MFRLRKNKKSKENNKSPKAEEQREMGFFDHLEELRKRIIIALIGLIAGCFLTGAFVNQIMDYILLKPAITAGLKLQNLRPFGQPMLFFQVIIISGIVVSFPFMLYQIWKFIEPGLYISEKRWAQKITFYTTLCFLSGVAFAYFVMIPTMLAFAANFKAAAVANNFDIGYYFSFISMMVLASGLVFEMPMISFVLSKFGILKPAFLRKYRRHAIIILLIVAAIITPTPDPINQMIFATPLFILYEISILVSKFAQKKIEPEEAITI